MKEYAETGGTLDVTTIDATKDQGTYKKNGIPQKLEDILPNIKEPDKDKIIIDDGKIEYIGPDEDEKTWAIELGISIHTENKGPLPIDISAGWCHSLAVLSDGTVKSWGYNDEGELGDGTILEKYIPITVPGLTNVKQIAGGAYHTVALLNDGTVKAWGANWSGELGDGTTNDSYIPVTVSGLTNVKQIAAGDEYTLALLNDGTVKAWGWNSDGQLGNGTIIEQHVPITVPGLINVKQIVGGIHHTVALLNDGTVKAWGGNWNGELGDGTTNDSNVPIAVPGLTNVKQIAAGYGHTLALLNDGTVKSWGSNDDGELGDGTTNDSHIPITVSGLTGVNQIAAGYNHAVALLNDGTVKAWGDNFNGQLGDGTTNEQHVPITVSGLTNVKQISSRNSFTLALLNDGTVKSWGANWNGQLGNGTKINSCVPIDAEIIDKKGPTIGYSELNINEGVFSVKVTAIDYGSGVNESSLQYVWDTQNVTVPSGGWTPFTNGTLITKNNDATYYLWVKANDNKGNSTVDKSMVIEFATPVSTVQTENKTLSGATTGFSYNNPVIPEGFTAVNTIAAKWDNLSTDWNKGLVIQDAVGNQFVWVPVDGTNVPYAKLPYPGTIDDTLPSGIASESDQITTYGGFYIARYEAGNVSSVLVSKRIAPVWVSINYADSKTKAEAMYNTVGVKSGLVTGTQWDTTMKWIQNSGKSITDSRAWGNYNNSTEPANIIGYGIKQVSGFSEFWKAKNIYDLAGNVTEWTNEIISTSYPTTRSGCYAYSGSSFSTTFRNAGSPSGNNSNLSFRVALYIL